MSEKLPMVDCQQLVRALKRAGFVEPRQKDSHLHMRRASDSKRVTVPIHKGQIAVEVLGQEAAETFDGLGYCYIETGDQQAARGDGEFFALPHPQMTAHPAGLAQKQAWAEDWVKRYFQ
jgi:predicted RNA binding protein YcfA (HicA-like mRNA interferase family)